MLLVRTQSDISTHGWACLPVQTTKQTWRQLKLEIRDLEAGVEKLYQTVHSLMHKPLPREEAVGSTLVPTSFVEFLVESKPCFCEHKTEKVGL